MKNHSGKEIFKLGFGLMRLPKLEDGSIDIEQTKLMADKFIEAGGTYFDTAYVYDAGGSEEAFRKAVAERYPREVYTVCTKLNAWHMAADEKAAKQQFFTSLERCGCGYFDFYLLHALMTDNYKKYDDYGLWDFVKEQKEKGLIRHWGFSYHAGPKLLEELLTAHPEVDFVQLQINYADWENPAVEARANYEVCERFGKPVVVMEPIKGGSLADPPEAVKELLKDAAPGKSFASWAVRYAASLPCVMTVLSGMSNTAQMEDNLSYMKDFRPLDDAERAVLDKAQKIIMEDISIPCTGCRYCTEGCPMQIPIPDIFEVSNDNLKKLESPRARRQYAHAVKEKGKASDCVECGQCESACPQGLKIIELLKTCRAMEQ